MFAGSPWPQEGAVGSPAEGGEEGQRGGRHHGQCEGPAHGQDRRGQGQGLAEARSHAEEIVRLLPTPGQ